MKTYQSQYSKRRNYYKKPFHKTKGFYILLILIIVVVGFIWWSIKRSDNPEFNNQKFSDQAGQPAQNARLTYVAGQVELKTSDEPWTEIAENYQVGLDDSVRTSRDAKAILELPDKSLIRMAGNAELQFKELGLADIVIEQTAGNVFHRVNDQSTAIYRVKNKQTELIALGTAFNVLASSKLTYLTVTENRVKVKIYNSDDIINMQTIEAGSQAIINTSLKPDQMIKNEGILIGDLLDDDWFAWNLEKDREQDFFLGIFAQALKLVVTEPEKSKIIVNDNKITLKGETEPDAEIFVAGQELENDNGHFENEILLSSGENKLVIVVKRGKKQNKKTLFVTAPEKEEEEGTEISTEPDQVNNISVQLTGYSKDKRLNLNWQVNNLEITKGFKVLMDEKPNVVFPGKNHHLITDSKATSDTWINLTEGQTYYFKVCQNLGSSVGVCSDEVAITFE